MKTILVAEDEQTIREISVKRLEREGYTVIAACDGLEATQKAIKEKPDLILLDIKMPKMDGIQVCQALKANDATKEIIIVAFTAKAELEDKRRARDAGVDLYLTKPVRFSDIIQHIRQLLSGSES